MGLTLRILWLAFLLACSQWLGAARAGEGEAPAAPAPAGERPVDDGYRALGDSDVAIPVPEGFVPASSFIGFQNPAHGASFVLKTWDLPLKTALGGCTAESFGARQRRLLGREEVGIGPRTGVLLELALSRGGHDYREWFLVLGDGMAGVEIVAEARHAEGGIPMVAYQLVLFEEGRYWLALGLAGRDGHPEAVDAFRRMARSLTRQPAAGQREGAAKPGTAD